MITPSRSVRLPGLLGRVSISLLLGLAAATLYLGTLTRDHSVDAVIYAARAEVAVMEGRPGIHLFNPAHVLHTATGAAATAAIHGLGLPLRALTLFQVLSALAGGATVGLLHAWLVRRTKAPLLATASAVALALSGAVWAWAVQGEPNLPALALAAVALFPLARLLRREERPATGSVVSAGVFLGLAAGYHLTLGTLWIALLAAAPFAGREAVLRALGALAIAAGVLAIAYVPRGWFLLDNPQAGWLDLVTFAGSSPYPSYLGRSDFAPLAQLAATVRSIAPAGGAGWLRILARLSWLLPAAWCAALILAPWRRRGERSLLVLLAIWFLGNVLLYAAWGDRNFEFTAFLLVPLAVGGTLGLARLLGSEGERRRDLLPAGLVGGAALCAGVAVAGATVGPGLGPEPNPARKAVEQVLQGTDPGATIVVAGGPETRSKIYVPYFTGRPVLIPDFFFGGALDREASLDRFESRLRAACARGPVYVLGHLGDREGPDTFEGIPYEPVRERLLPYAPRSVGGAGASLLLRLERCPA